MYVHTYTQTYIHTYTYIYTCTYTRIHAHTYTYAYAHVCTDRISQQQRLNVSSNIIDAHTHPYACACIYTHIYIYTYVHNLQRVCRRCVRWCKTHLCNIHTCPCTSDHNTCKVHVTLTAKKCTYICTYTHMYTHAYAHENTCACMTLSTR